MLWVWWRERGGWGVGHTGVNVFAIMLSLCANLGAILHKSCRYRKGGVGLCVYIVLTCVPS